MTLDPHAPDATSPVDRPSTRRERLVAVAFTVALILPGLATIAGVRPDLDENRRPEAFPVLTIDGLGASGLYASIDRAVNDAFPLRVPAIRAHATLDHVILGGTSNPDVVPGTDGWLFSREEMRPPCRTATADFLATLDAAAAMADRAGVTFRFVVAPDKHAIYPEHLPSTIEPADICTDRRRAEVADALRSRDTAIELWSPLQDMHADDPDVPLYYATDTHWTPLGARVAAELLVGSLSVGLWDDEEVLTRPGRNRQTDLARQMGLPQVETVDNFVARPRVRFRRTVIDVDVELDNSTEVAHFRVAPKVEVIPGRTLFLYNSFFAPHMRQFAPWFADSIWVHADDFRDFPEIAESLPAFDTIVVVRVERSVYDTDVAALLRPLLAP